MNMTDPRDSFYTKQEDALNLQRQIIRHGGKAYVRRYNHPTRGSLYRLRVQKKTA